jgi:hypothetical protein
MWRRMIVFSASYLRHIIACRHMALLRQSDAAQRTTRAGPGALSLVCRSLVQHWCVGGFERVVDAPRFGVSVILDGLPMHPRCRRVIALCRWMLGCPLRVLRGSAVPGVW